jgi:SulP family sulfate permease
LAALAAVLGLVAWNMIEKETIAALYRHDRAAFSVVALTFLLVVFVDLIIGIAAGAVLGLILQRTGHLKAH